MDSVYVCSIQWRNYIKYWTRQHFFPVKVIPLGLLMWTFDQTLVSSLICVCVYECMHVPLCVCASAIISICWWSFAQFCLGLPQTATGTRNKHPQSPSQSTQTHTHTHTVPWQDAKHLIKYWLFLAHSIKKIYISNHFPLMLHSEH